MKTAAMIALGLMFVAGCASSPEGSARPWAFAKARPHTSVVVTLNEDAQMPTLSIRTSDGRSWTVPTVYYFPDKVGIDGMLMKDYAQLRNVVSPTNDIVVLEEILGGEDHAIRGLFIDGGKARLYSLNGVRRKLLPGEPLVGLTGVVNAVSNRGVVIDSSFFGWEDLHLRFEGEYQAD